MADNKKIQENIKLYKHFNINYKFKEEKVKESFDNILKEINTLKLSKFNPKFELKSTILENIFPDLKTNLILNFEKFQIRIDQNNVNIIFPKEKGVDGHYPRILSKIFSRLRFLERDEEQLKFSIEEINEINDLFKLYLIQKFFEIKEEINPKSIEIMSIISIPKEFNFNFVNNLLKDNIKSNKKYEISSIDFDISEDENVYSISLEQEMDEMFFLSLLKGKTNWSKSILEILNENIIKLKEIIKELNI